MYDLDIVQRDGFFRGYNSVVWTAVMLQAGGGLVYIPTLNNSCLNLAIINVFAFNRWLQWL